MQTTAALMYPQPRALDPFTLSRADGGSFGNDDLRGRLTLVFFGFTHCPDICPTTLALMVQVRDQVLAAQPDLPVQLLFVSVDPERDSPQALARYAGYFSPHIIAATADDARLLPMTRQLGIVYVKSQVTDSGYSVDHSSQIVLIDAQGRLAGMFRPPLDARVIAQDLQTIARAGT